jgi:ABC-2 type transport system ATP-binding protein
MLEFFVDSKLALIFVQMSYLLLIPLSDFMKRIIWGNYLNLLFIPNILMYERLKTFYTFDLVHICLLYILALVAFLLLVYITKKCMHKKIGFRKEFFMSTIKMVNYSKVIKKKLILNNITYTFESGNIYGLFGRNGSGKTMILRAIAGLIFPSSGYVEIDGKILHKDIDFPPSIGVIIENTELLPQYSGFENLKILGEINKKVSEKDILKTLDEVGLSKQANLKVKEYSLGMKQKLSIAQAIFEKPRILLLDEPTNALDEDSILTVRNILLNLKKQGCTILIASHHKEDLNILADQTLKIVEGEIR